MQTVTFAHPFREAGGLADAQDVDALYDLALGGRGFFLDLNSDRLSIGTMPITRQQTDDNDETGLGSLASQEVWRKQARSWHEGAGQLNGDEQGSSGYRFDSSKGVDPWTKWQLTLLPDTTRVVTDVSPLQAVIVADGVIYHQANQVIRSSSDGITWATLVTLPTAATSQIITDGVDLYVGCTDGIKKVTSGGVVTTAFAVNDATVLGFSKGRLWAGAGADLYAMSPTVAPAVAASAPWGSGSWVWTAICDGRRATYAAGYAGERSHVYRIPLADNGADLDAAVEAWTAPDGELVHALTSYLGYVVLGTTLGARFALADGTGDLTPGSYIPTAGPVRAFEAQDRFVWFGWSDYDTASTGLGRIDLSVFTATLTPGYASDLMHTGQGDVTSIVTFGNRRIFTVAGRGVIREADTPVPSGTLTGSAWTFGLDDDKLVTALDVSHSQLDGIVQLALVLDGNLSGTLVESSRVGSNGPTRPVAINPVTASRVAMHLTLTPGTGDGPRILGYKLLAKPLPPLTLRLLLPLMLTEQANTHGVQRAAEPFEDLLFIRQLWRAGAPVTLQYGAESFTVFVANFEWTPYRDTPSGRGWTGTCVVELREVAR